MSNSVRILVSTDALADADLVRKLLSDEFDNVFISTDPDRAAEDFEKHRPGVLILAFDELEKAERYYLGLYRLSNLVHTLAHRTVVLCSKDNVRRVYELCRKQHFDDYVLFWPLTQDAPRLLMAVHHVLRLLAAETGAPSVSEFAAHARRLAGVQPLLEEQVARGVDRIDLASRSLQQAQDNIDRLQHAEIATQLDAVAAAMAPVRDWAGTLQADIAPKFESARVLRKLADNVRPLVLLVDDDEFQHKLLRTLLREIDLELVVATSGSETFATLRRCRPDLILMDVELPDVDGVEITRRIKSAGQFAQIPVLMITGHSDKNVVVQSMRAGAAGMVVKPFNKQALLAKVRACLSGAEAESPRPITIN